METLSRRYDRATYLFDSADYIGAARALAEIVATDPDAGGARLLLARAYYHSAQLGRAENELRRLVGANPTDVYAQLLLGRTLQRQSRHGEAAGHLRLAEAMTAADAGVTDRVVQRRVRTTRTAPARRRACQAGPHPVDGPGDHHVGAAHRHRASDPVHGARTSP